MIRFCREMFAKYREQLAYLFFGGVTTLVNKLWERPEPPEGKTIPPVAGTPTEEIDDYGTPLGIDVIINHVGDCYD